VIDNTEFKRAWTAIVDRFGKEFNPKIAAAYYEFLSPQMDTETFLAAARTVWASAKWFPRPADFLTAGVGDEWRRVDVWMDPSLTAVERDEKWRALSARTRETVKRLGGLDAMRGVKDVLRLKSAFEQTYEQAMASEVLALPVGGGGRRLTA
jgi:hypothetical protein